MNLADLVIPPWVRLAGIAAVLVGCAGAGWYARGVIADAAMSRAQNQFTQQKETAVAEALKVQSDRFALLQKHQSAEADIDKGELAKLKGEKDENDRLRECLRNGTCGLRISAKCPTIRPSDVPGTPASTGVDTGNPAELDGSAQRGYIALRAGISLVQRQLSACQATVKNYTGQ